VGTDARRFPGCSTSAGRTGSAVLAADAGLARVIVGRELLYRHTLIGRAFLAIVEEPIPRALGLPERGLRMASYALAGMIGALAGFAGGECCWPTLPCGRY